MLLQNFRGLKKALTRSCNRLDLMLIAYSSVPNNRPRPPLLLISKTLTNHKTVE